MPEEAEETELQELIIPVVSQALFREAVETLPVTVEGIDFLHFAADGIPTFSHTIDVQERNRDLARYINECRDKKVLPYARTVVTVYDVAEPFIKVYFGDDTQPQRFMSGERTRELDIGEGTNFARLKSSGILAAIFNKGYHISDGKIRLTSKGVGSHTERGVETMDALLLGSPAITKDVRSTIEGLELRIGRLTTEEDDAKLTRWFEALKSKYQP